MERYQQEPPSSRIVRSVPSNKDPGPFGFMLLALLLWISVVLVLEINQFVEKRRLAAGIVDSVRNSVLTQDFRRAVGDLRAATRNDFSGIILRREGLDPIIILETESRWPSLTVELPVLFDPASRDSRVAARFSFRYSTANLIPVHLIIAGVVAILLRAASARFSALKEREIVVETVRAQSEAKLSVAREVAHDLRSPANALSALVSNLTTINSEERHLLLQISDRIQGICNQLLNKGRGSTQLDPSQMEGTRTPIVELVNDLVWQKKVEHPLVTIQVESTLGETKVFAGTLDIEIGRMISNLINNAVEASTVATGPAQITVHLFEAKDAPGAPLGINIIDRGTGISPEVLSRLNSEERGVTSGKANQSTGGNGIGITHAKQLVRSCGGKFWVDSSPGQGTQVHIRLPIASVG